MRMATTGELLICRLPVMLIYSRRKISQNSERCLMQLLRSNHRAIAAEDSPLYQHHVQPH